MAEAMPMAELAIPMAKSAMFWARYGHDMGTEKK
jgi:hypothetical protein